MPKEELIAMALYRFAKGVNIEIGNAILENNLADTALSLAVHKDHRVSFRISWGVEYAFFKSPQTFAKYHDAIVENYLLSATESTHRIYGKLVCHLLRKGIQTVRTDDIAEKAFDLLISEKVMVASKVWAMEILYILCDSCEWVLENLAPAIEKQAILSPTPAMVNHTSKLLKRITKRNGH